MLALATTSEIREPISMMVKDFSELSTKRNVTHKVCKSIKINTRNKCNVHHSLAFKTSFHHEYNCNLFTQNIKKIIIKYIFAGYLNRFSTDFSVRTAMTFVCNKIILNCLSIALSFVNI